jgi:hypothetical protein
MESLIDQEQSRAAPRSVLAAKGVDLALITYVDEQGTQITQLAVVGDNRVHVLDGKPMGFSKVTTPQGLANDWLRDGVFAKLGRKVK